MRKIIFIISLLLSATMFAQVTNIPVTKFDTVTLNKNGVNVTSAIAGDLDSAQRWTLTKFQKVPPIQPTTDSLKILSVSKLSGTGTLSHTIIAPAGALVVVATGFEGAKNNCTIGGATSLTWTKNADASAAGSGDAEIFTSTVTGGTYTITTSWGATGFQTSVVYVISGAEGIGAKVAVVGDVAPMASITTTKANSLLIAVSSDFDGRDGSGRVYRDGATEVYYQRSPTKGGTDYNYTKVATTIKQYTEGLSSPANMKAGTAIIEVKAKLGVTQSDTESPSAPALSVSGATATSLNLNWTASTDNIGVTGYDVYVNGVIKTTVTGSSYVLTGLKALTQYVLLVQAKDAAGNSRASNVVTATTLANPNQPPTARAGNDISITLPVESTTLNGSGSTDPDGTISLYSWSYLSGPQTWTMANASAVSTGLSNLVVGTYIFRLTVTDNNGATGIDDIQITVNGATPVDTSGVVINEGFGANAVGGGNSSVVYHVTNTNGSGAGSLANGIGSNKTIVFDVGGTFYDTRLDLANISYLTIDGNTAPSPVILDGKKADGNYGKGGDVVSFDGANSHHCILRGIEARNAGNDCINALDGAHDILITNCSAFNAVDGEIDIAGANNVTIQWCIMGASATGGPGCMLITATNISAHHNLYSPAKANTPGERCPLVHCNYSPVGNPNADVRWNTIWKFGRDNGNGSGYGTAFAYNATGNAVGNYYYSVGSSPGSATNTDDGYGAGATGKMYAAQNTSGNSGVNANSASNHTEYPSPVISVPAGATPCSEARRVILKAGPKNKSPEIKALLAAIPATLPNCQ